MLSHSPLTALPRFFSHFVCPPRVDYSKVAKVVAPKRARVEQMNLLLKEANEKLAIKQKELQDVVDKVQELKAKCEATLAEKQSLDAKTSQTEKRLERAQKLTTGLASEEVRWARDAEEIGLKLVDIVGNAFISAACISYYGPFTGKYREQLVTSWHKACLARKIPTSADFTLAATLGNPVEIRQWNINGLPTDATSIDSGILVKRGGRFPLAIDPQEQAKRWIKAEYKSKLVVTRAGNKDMLKAVENACKNGLPLLIEDIGESLDASLDPILLKQTFVKGGLTYVRLGDSEVEFDPKFRLYLSTKITNPHYLPEQQIKGQTHDEHAARCQRAQRRQQTRATGSHLLLHSFSLSLSLLFPVLLLNFSITRSGLEDQLLGDVVKKEAFEVEEKRNKSIAAMAKDRKSLDEIEARILMLLSESQGVSQQTQEGRCWVCGCIGSAVRWPCSPV